MISLDAEKGREIRLANLKKRHVRRVIRAGSLVLHERHGVGRVIRQWGSWKEKLPDKGTTIDVNANDIYDVRFGSKNFQSLHKSKLKVLKHK